MWLYNFTTTVPDSICETNYMFVWVFIRYIFIKNMFLFFTHRPFWSSLKYFGNLIVTAIETSVNLKLVSFTGVKVSPIIVKTLLPHISTWRSLIHCHHHAISLWVISNWKWGNFGISLHALSSAFTAIAYTNQIASFRQNFVFWEAFRFRFESSVWAKACFYSHVESNTVRPTANPVFRR